MKESILTKKKNGMLMLVLTTLVELMTIGLLIFGIILSETGVPAGYALAAVGLFVFWLAGYLLSD